MAVLLLQKNGGRAFTSALKNAHQRKSPPSGRHARPVPGPFSDPRVPERAGAGPAAKGGAESAEKRSQAQKAKTQKKMDGKQKAPLAAALSR